MWNDATGFLIGLAPGYSLHDVEVVQHVIQAAVVWEAIEKRSHGVLRGHKASFFIRMSRVYDPLLLSPSVGQSSIR